MFSPEEVEYLRTLPAVVRVTERRITYSDAFKNACVRRYLAGESPVKLFREAGLDPAIIGHKRIERCFARWREHALDGDNPSTRTRPENNRGGGSFRLQIRGWRIRLLTRLPRRPAALTV